MAEHRFAAASQYRCHPTPFQSQSPVSDRVDTTMHANHLPPLDEAGDGVPSEPRFEQLPPRDHAMLHRGERRDSTWTT